ncbi:hypothetical protein ACWGJ9_11710 [Curtobacterium citreum]
MRIRIYDHVRGETRDSTRDYVVHEMTTGLREYEHERAEHGVREFYVDQDNGLVVSDIARYEAWVSTLITQPAPPREDGR